MSEFIKFTDEEIQRASDVDLEVFLTRQGEALIKSGKEQRLVSDHSITIDGNHWYDHAEQCGGTAISFVKRLYGLNFPQAVKMLLRDGAYPSAHERVERERKTFALPAANHTMRRVFAYLAYTRFISGELISNFASRHLIYEDAQYHNAVFVGVDRDGIARHAHKHGTGTKGKVFRQNVEGSDLRYSFNHLGTGNSLYVFESPIDLLSYITLHPENWHEQSYVACCGTSIRPVRRMLEEIPQIKTVVICLDNDDAGHCASRQMMQELSGNYIVKRHNPESKDWNDDLRAKHMMLKEVK